MRTRTPFGYPFRGILIIYGPAGPSVKYLALIKLNICGMILMPHSYRTTRAKGPRGPDTLNPNGISIIQPMGAFNRPPWLHVEPGPLRGPYAINLFSLCSCGGSRQLCCLPPAPPFYIRCLSSDVVFTTPGG